MAAPFLAKIRQAALIIKPIFLVWRQVTLHEEASANQLVLLSETRCAKKPLVTTLAKSGTPVGKLPPTMIVPKETTFAPAGGRRGIHDCGGGVGKDEADRIEEHCMQRRHGAHRRARCSQRTQRKARATTFRCKSSKADPCVSNRTVCCLASRKSRSNLALSDKPSKLQGPR
eukprot:3498794-Amphidinium_carterae.3